MGCSQGWEQPLSVLLRTPERPCRCSKMLVCKPKFGRFPGFFQVYPWMRTSRAMPWGRDPSGHGMGSGHGAGGGLAVAKCHQTAGAQLSGKGK